MDSELFIEHAQQGGAALERTMRELIREHGTLIFRRCARDLHAFRLGDQEVEDCTQETFLKVWRCAAGFRGDCQLLTWIETVRRSVVNDFRDKLTRRQEVPLEAPDGSLDVGAQAALDAAALAAREQPIRAMQADDVRRCLHRQLKAFATHYPGDVTVLQWIVIDEIGNDELATLLGRTAGATREYKSQLMKKARRFFDECRRLALGES